MESAVLQGGSFVRPIDVIREIGVSPGMKVADIGTGSGAYVFAAAPLVGKIGRVYAIDVQKELLTRIKNTADTSGLENVEVVWGDVEEPHGTKLADGVADLVVISNVLFQFEEKDRALAEAARILKEGGQLAIIDWSESFGGMGPKREDVVVAAEARTLGEGAGLRFVREFVAGEHHYGLLFRKTE